MKQKLFTILALILFSLSINAQVFITEIADPDNEAGARFVELYNAGVAEVDLSTGWQINRYTNNNATPQTAVDLTGTIPAGGFYIICANQTTFTATYGFAANQDIGTGGPADSNGDDQIFLLSPGSVIVDFFGVIAEDGSNTCHEFEDGRAERIASVTAGNPTWDEAEWNVWSDASTASGCTNHTADAPQTAPGDFDPGDWIGHVNPNDETSTVTTPGTQISAGTLSSINTDSVPVIQFIITDAATSDGLPTNVTGIFLNAGTNNTLDFNINLSGGGVYDKTNNTVIPVTGQPTVTANTAFLPIALSVPNGGSVTVEAYVYLDNTNAPDGAVLQFQVNAASHGFTADGAGSDFEDPFAGGDITGNNFTVEVIATQLSFVSQPSNVVAGTTMSAVEVGATDINGNVDGDYADTPITLSFSGTGTMTGTNPVSTSSGLATFSDLSFDTEETGVTLTAAGAFSGATSDAFDVTGTPAGTLFLSEYIESDGGNNKAVEIYNPTGATVDLTGYTVKLASNANAWGNTADLTGFSLNDGDVFVISNAGSDDPNIVAASDMTSDITYFNGNDAIGLFFNDVLIDVIGVEGANTGQDVAGVTDATYNHTLVRKYPEVTTGNTDWASSAGTDASNSEWIVYDANTFSYIGWHGTAPNAAPEITNLAHAPTAPTSSDAVIVSATITDDVAVTGANLYWSLTSPVTTADNPTVMTNVFDVYSATIGVQADGTTVYYMIDATDGTETTTSSEMSYTVTDAATGGGATCAEAVLITAGTHHSIHTIEGDGNIYDQWFSFVATVSGTATVENCASDVDIYFLIQQGTCGNDYNMADDDNCGVSGLSENFTFDITIGETYFIGIGNWDQAIMAEYDWTLTETEVIPPVTINAIQYTTVPGDGTYPSLLVGQTVTTTGIVSAIEENAGVVYNYYIQDADGAWNGVYVYDNNFVPAVGDEVTIKADVVEYNGLTELSNVTEFTVNSSGNTLFAPVEISTLEANDEQYEGVLIKVTDAECTNDDVAGNYGMWELNDGTGAILADDDLYAYTPTAGTNYNVTGLGHYSFGAFKIIPRNADDIVEIISTAAVTFTVDNNANTSYTGFSVKGSWDIDGNYDASWTGGNTDLYDDGTNGDVTAGDNIWTVIIGLVPDGGVNNWEWGVNDQDGNWIDGNFQFSVIDSSPFTLSYACVGINKISSEGISIYPNPSNGLFNVNVKENFNLEVIDIAGKIINSKTISGNSIIQINTQGVYFLRFSNENGSVTQRIIVQ